MRNVKEYYRSAIRLDMLESTITDEINLQLQNFYDKNSLERQYHSSKNVKDRYPDRISALELEKTKLETKVNEQSIYYRNLYEDKMKKVISEDEFAILKESFLQELEDSKKRIQVIEEELKLLKIQKDKKDSIVNSLKKYKKINKLNKVIMDEFIDKIYIGQVNKEAKERDITIDWNIEELA